MRGWAFRDEATHTEPRNASVSMQTQSVHRMERPVQILYFKKNIQHESDRGERKGCCVNISTHDYLYMYLVIVICRSDSKLHLNIIIK